VSRICVEDEVYIISDFKETPWKISANIETKEKKYGTIEVFYAEEKPDSYKGPFLEKEVNLINTLSIELGKFLRRRKLNDVLAGEEELYNTTLQSIGDGVITTNVYGQVTFMNPVAEAITGWKLENANLEPLAQIFRIENELSGLPVKNPFEKIMVTGKIAGLSNHTQVISKDGRRIPIADSGAPIKSRTGEIVGVVIVFRDVTSIRAEQSKQKHYSEEIQFFVDLLTHDVKNILAITNGYLSICMENETEIDYVNFVSKIYQSNTKAVTLLNNVSLLMKLYSLNKRMNLSNLWILKKSFKKQLKQLR